MRILLANQYAGSPSLGMEYRPHWMAREWMQQGHEVLVVAGSYSHLRARQPTLGRSNIDEVDFFTLRTSQYSSNGARRFLNILSFRSQLYRAIPQLAAWRPDAVIASSTHPMDVRPALTLARRTGATLVHEIHDLWPLTPILLGRMSPKHPMIAWMQREENLACKEAAIVASMLPGTLPYLKAHGLTADRWLHVSQGVPEKLVQGRWDSALAPHEGFRVGYFGGHGVSNGLTSLIRAARILKAEPIEFHLTGSGPAKEELEVEATDLPAVHFHAQCTQDEARRRMRQMDVLVTTAAASDLYQYGIAHNKLFDYMASGRPVIQAVRASSSPVEAVECGLVCENDPIAIANAVRSAIAMGPEELNSMGMRGRAYVKEECTYSLVANRFINAIEGQAQHSHES